MAPIHDNHLNVCQKYSSHLQVAPSEYGAASCELLLLYVHLCDDCREARRYNVCPNVFTTQMARDHMINSHTSIPFSAVLTGIIVAAEYLPACQFDVWAWPMHLVLQPDHGGARQQLFYCTNVPAAIHNHI